MRCAGTFPNLLSSFNLNKVFPSPSYGSSHRACTEHKSKCLVYVKLDGRILTLLFPTRLYTRSGKHRRCPQKYRALIMPRLFGRKRTEPRRRGVLSISRDTLTRSSPLRLQFRLRMSASGLLRVFELLMQIAL